MPEAAPRKWDSNLPSLFGEAKRLAQDEDYRARVITQANQARRSLPLLDLYFEAASACLAPGQDPATLDPSPVVIKLNEFRKLALEGWVAKGAISRKIMSLIPQVVDGRSNAFDVANLVSRILRSIERYHFPEQHGVLDEYKVIFQNETTFAQMPRVVLEELRQKEAENSPPLPKM